MKNTFSIFEAKARLSEIIRIVQQQREIIITDRSKPVVKVVPFEQKKAKTNLLDRVEELHLSGQLVKNRRLKPHIIQIPLEKNILEKFLKERE